MSGETNWLEFFEDQERRHADFYLDFAQQYARRDADAYDRLEAESGNLLKISAWLAEQNDDENILKLAEALWQESDFMRSRGYMQRGLPLLEQALRAARQLKDLPTEFTWLNALAFAHGSNGNPALAVSLLEQVLALAEKIDEPLFQAKAQLDVGHLQMEMGHLEQAATWLKQALQGYRQCQEYEGEIDTLIVLGNLLSLQGDPENAVAYLEHGLHLAQTRQDQQGELSLRFALAYVGTATKNWAWAVELYEPVVEMTRHVGDRFLEIRALNNLGEARLELGDIQQAIKYLDEALMLQEMSDDVLTKSFTHLYLAKAHNTLNSPEISLVHLEHVYPMSQVPVLFPEAAEAAWVKADNYLKKNDTQQALGALQDVLNLAPNDMTSLRTAAENLLHLLKEE